MKRARDRARDAARKRRWRQDMAEQGWISISIVLPDAGWQLLDDMRDHRGFPGRSAFLTAYLAAVSHLAAFETLLKPPPPPPCGRRRQDKIMVPSGMVRLLAQVRVEHGLARAEAVYALLLTFPDPWAPKNSPHRSPDSGGDKNMKKGLGD